MVDADPNNFDIVDRYINTKFLGGGVNISSIEMPGKRIYFTPSVFQIPPTETEQNLLSVMMPFDTGFAAVHTAIKAAADRKGMSCQRADDIWVHTEIIQDVFSLIYRSYIVVCDFTGKNPNVLYEAGIAHTLGKHVIPITQYPADIPFDLRTHRYIQYHNNAEGHTKLITDVANRIETLLPNVRRYAWE